MTRPLFTALFWIDAFERAVKTFAQALLAVVGATQFDWWEASWLETLGSAGLAAGVSVLTSVVSAGVASGVSPASAVPTGGGEDDGQITLTQLVLVLAGAALVVWIAVALGWIDRS
jgi:hypothetical protein